MLTDHSHCFCHVFLPPETASEEDMGIISANSEASGAKSGGIAGILHQAEEYVKQTVEGVMDAVSSTVGSVAEEGSYLQQAEDVIKTVLESAEEKIKATTEGIIQTVKGAVSSSPQTQAGAPAAYENQKSVETMESVEFRNGGQDEEILAEKIEEYNFNAGA
jgi:hypothetical protein